MSNKETHHTHALLRRVAAGKEPVTPLEVYKLMRNEGMSRLRAWRTYRKLSSAALAKKIGKSHAYLTQIENGTREGSVQTLALLAKALGTTIDALAQ